MPIKFLSILSLLCCAGQAAASDCLLPNQDFKVVTCDIAAGFQGQDWSSLSIAYGTQLLQIYRTADTLYVFDENSIETLVNQPKIMGRYPDFAAAKTYSLDARLQETEDVLAQKWQCYAQISGNAAVCLPDEAPWTYLKQGQSKQ